MIGKAEWFQKKKFGYGITPKTWQGWAYIIVFVAIIMSTNFLTFLSEMQRTVLVLGAIAVMVWDSLSITRSMGSDGDKLRPKFF